MVGRALLNDIPHLALQKGDRLEPSAEIPDIGEPFDAMVVPLAGLPVTFWRPTRETLSRHRNPLFRRSLGITPRRCLVVDALHSLYLGIMLVWCRLFLWTLILDGFWCNSGTQEERVHTSHQLFKADLLRWYPLADKRLRKKLTRVTTITRKMIGNANEQVLKTKAAETYGLLLYLVELGESNFNSISANAQTLCRPGRDFIKLVELFDSQDAQMSVNSIQQCHAALTRHIALTEDFEELLIPKRHLCMHMINQIPTTGNPKKNANWRDESLNKLFKESCQFVSQARFELSVLIRMRSLLQDDVF